MTKSQFFIEKLNAKYIFYTINFLGYAVTSGYFFDRNELLYATSAPRERYLGQVLVFKFYGKTEMAMMIKATKQGQQYGEYFGGSLTAGDVNNDGFDDLIVGSPHFQSGKFDEGRIYLYLGGEHSFAHNTKKHVINGRSAGGKFGTTAMFLGDVDLDGFGGL